MTARRRGSFVGRQREVERILAALDERSGTRFIEVTGPGGIGKTTLLEEILNRLPIDVPVLSVLERDPYEDPAGAMVRMVERFTLAFGRDDEFRPFLRAARFHRWLARGGASTRTLAWIVPGIWGRNPDGALADSFLASVETLFRRRIREDSPGAGKAGRTVVFAVDGYERAEPILTRWLHLELLPRLARSDLAFEPKAIFSGREPLAARDQSWDALGYLDAMITVPLAPLEPGEAAALLAAQGVDNEGEREAIVRAAGGHPLWLSLAAQPAAARASEGSGPPVERAATRAQVVKHLERRILRWVDGERQRHWIRTAAHLEWFDRDSLRALLEAEGETAYEWLVAQPSLLDPASEKHSIEPFARNVLRSAVRLDSESLSIDLRERAEVCRRVRRLLDSLPSPAVSRFVLGIANAPEGLEGEAAASRAAEANTEIKAWMETSGAASIVERSETGWKVRPGVRGLLARWAKWTSTHEP